MEAAPGRAAATDMLTKEGQGFQTALQKMQDSINGLLSKYQKDEPTLTASVKESKQKAIQALETEFQAKQVQFQKQFDDRTKEVMAPITDQVKKVIDDIRVEDGYAIILDNAPAPATSSRPTRIWISRIADAVSGGYLRRRPSAARAQTKAVWQAAGSCAR
jgi:Skp family chaperone for outer membrane proteins